MAKEGKKKKKKRGLSTPRKVIIIICCVVLAAAIGYGIYYLIETNETNRLAEETADEYLIYNGPDIDDTDDDSDEEFDPYAPGSYQVDWDNLTETNSDVVAWIQVPAIPSINFPVVHYIDNDYYLRRSWQGDYLVSGCIMEDYHCSPDFTDFHTIIYGHNMSNGTMFGTLKKFQNQSFYDNNDKRVIIYTPERTLYYTIFSIHVVYPNDPDVYLVGEFQRKEAFDFVENLRNISDIETGVYADGDDQILTLSTCSGSSSTKRLVIHSVLTLQTTPEGEEIIDDTGDTSDIEEIDTDNNNNENEDEDAEGTESTNVTVSATDDETSENNEGSTVDTDAEEISATD